MLLAAQLSNRPLPDLERLCHEVCQDLPTVEATRLLREARANMYEGIMPGIRG